MNKPDNATTLIYQLAHNHHTDTHCDTPLQSNAANTTDADAAHHVPLPCRCSNDGLSNEAAADTYRSCRCRSGSRCHCSHVDTGCTRNPAPLYSVGMVAYADAGAVGPSRPYRTAGSMMVCVAGGAAAGGMAAGGGGPGWRSWRRVGRKRRARAGTAGIARAGEDCDGCGEYCGGGYDCGL